MRTLELTELEDKEFEELCGSWKNEKKESVNNSEDTSITISELQEKNNRDKLEKEAQSSSAQGIISVSITKLNKLIDLVGEMVIAEAMVTQNPDLKGLNLDNFQKAARQLQKISGELQDMVMSIRMVPISSTFNKMHRIVRDMSKKLDKQVALEIIGEETEVDKNIIEHISDPLMHVVRNSIDHGLEATEDRIAAGKPPIGTITIEAKNAGSDVLIIVKDDGRGLDKEKILKRAKENGLLHKPENLMTDKEIYSLVFLPGFSTTEKITEFSGRGVGMDVVSKNIEAVGGTTWIDSSPGVGTITTMKIPLTLAIIDGMNVRVGNSCYTIPTTDIRESFRPEEKAIIKDPIRRLIPQYPLPVIVVSSVSEAVFDAMGAGAVDFVTKPNVESLRGVKETQGGERIEQGKVIIAPGDRQIKVVKVGTKFIVELGGTEKVNGHCPSVDVLFESVARSAGNNAIGIILTGMGYDGAKGLLAMRRKGARTIGQDEETSVVYGMPKVAFDIGAVEKQTSLENIPHVVFSMLR